ncbi:hypothetical protein PIB30_072328, partial [Stylosanthes scabra]|nr:hypothetical protein [Stylosanthes scabra]
MNSGELIQNQFSNQFSEFSLTLNVDEGEEWAECVLSFPFIATNEWQFCNFAVRFVPDLTINVGVRFRVLNIFVIISMFSFSIFVIPDGAKPVPPIKLTAGANGASYFARKNPLSMNISANLRNKSRSLVHEKVGVYIVSGREVSS